MLIQLLLYIKYFLCPLNLKCMGTHGQNVPTCGGFTSFTVTMDS